MITPDVRPAPAAASTAPYDVAIAARDPGTLRQVVGDIGFPIALLGGTALLGVALGIVRPEHLLTIAGPTRVVFVVGAYLVGAWYLLAWRGYAAPPPRVRLLTVIATALVVQLTFSVVHPWKVAVAEWGFGWDEWLANLDLQLHGAPPWRLLPATPAFTVALDRVYASLLPVTIAVLVWQAWHGERMHRRRFLVAWTLTWVLLGILGAHALGSAGPCYIQHVTGAPEFVGLTDYLRGVHSDRTLYAVMGQEWLWSVYRGGRLVPYSGISAMPSLHVALPVLFACASWTRHRRLAYVFGAYALVIFIGSVALGWHYAVDGEASALAVPGIWWFAGRLSR